VPFADHIGQPIPRRYSPPDHRKDHPIERCWGILEWQWQGTQLIAAETRLEWARRMTWKGLHPVVELRRKGYHKGIALGKQALQAVERRLERHPELPTWAILIRPASAL
jgi:Rhodopirellula transposase DDE domain